MYRSMTLLSCHHKPLHQFTRNLQYIQGQSPSNEPSIREYFYYIDHQGMLFLDDSRMKNFTSCFKDKQFLHFFFTRLRMNDSGKYEDEFPYLSPCGREKNYVRCDDLPVVFTHVMRDKDGEEQFAYAHAGELLKVPFEPHKLCMLSHTGRVYHPAMENVGGVGLVRSAFAIEISKYFKFESHMKDNEDDEKRMPTHFVWNAKQHLLTNELIDKLNRLKILN